MTDENKQRLLEEQEDAALELLMNEYAEIEGEALWREFQAAQAAGNGPDAQPRENREWSRRSRKTNRRTNYLKCVGNGCRRAAVIFLVLVCLLSPLVMSVEAFKIPVLNYFVALEKKFSAFNFGENKGLSQEQEEVIKLIQSQPCPDGYQISNYQISAHENIWIHFSHEGNITMKILIHPSSGQISIDTEDVIQTPMKIHDYEAVYLLKEGRRLIWMDAERELIFDLYTTELDEDGFWRYAYSLTAKLSQ